MSYHRKRRSIIKKNKHALHHAIMDAKQERTLFNRLHRRVCGHILKRFVNGTIDISSVYADDSVMRASKQIKRLAENFYCIVSVP